MKALLFGLAALVVLSGCKKVKESVVETAAINFLDGTEWRVTAFTEGPTSHSADFSTFIFRFNRDQTVTALRDQVPAAAGVFRTDVANRSIYANFPAGTPHPLILLNATWTITQSTMRTLTATTTVGSQPRELKMERN